MGRMPRAPAKEQHRAKQSIRTSCGAAPARAVLCLIIPSNLFTILPVSKALRLRISPTLLHRSFFEAFKMNSIGGAFSSGWDALGPQFQARQQQLAAVRQSGETTQGFKNAKALQEAHEAKPQSVVYETSDTAETREPRSENRGLGELSEDEQQVVRKLQARDREVRAHEEAHATVGGQYAGTPSYTFQSGPDGKRYAIGGEVPIDVSPVDGDPEATIDKMRIVIAAALAPAEPSGQDRKVASIAQSQQMQAYGELMAERSAERNGSGYDKKL